MNGPKKRYRFAPLRGDGDFTRVLYLAPGKADDTLRGSLRMVKLSAPPPYEALSYEWASSEKTHTIVLDDDSDIAGGSRSAILHITESLYHALRDLRHDSGDHARAIWADAVCINQENVAEQQAQVAIMATIYRAAVRVITYIGPEKEGSVAAIGFARYLVALAERERRLGWEDPTAKQPDFHRTLPPADDPRWMALKELILRGWSSRAWCAHEFLLNESLLVMCGRTELPDWDLFSEVVRLAWRNEIPAYFLPRGSEDPHAITESITWITGLRRQIFPKHHHRSGGSGSHMLSLADLLVNGHPLQATKPHDKIYALLGLASAEDRAGLGLVIDYGMPVQDLYVRVAWYLVTRPGVGLGLLYSCLHTKNVPNLPSWVPDWSTWHFGSYSGAYDNRYRASSSTSTQRSKNHVILQPGNKLQVSGGIVDRVASDNLTVTLRKRIGYFYSHVGDPRLDAERCAWIDRQLHSLEERKSEGRRWPYCKYRFPYGNRDTNDGQGHSPREVLWRTLVGNLTKGGWPVPDYYARYFDAAHRELPVRPEMDKMDDKTVDRTYEDRSEDDNCQTEREDDENENENERTLQREARKFCDAARRRSRYRCLGATELGYVAALPINVQPGDLVCVLQGARHMFVLRERPGSRERPRGRSDVVECEYVGHTYVHGLMNGAAVRLREYQEKTFLIS